MKTQDMERLDRRLTEYLRELVSGMGRPERVRAMCNYVRGLLLDGERKSMQPMAARLARDPSEAEALRQSMQQCVAHAEWDDQELFGAVARMVDSEMDGISAWVIDDTGFPKKGVHSVGVARQYSGTLGRTENCQVATSLHLAATKQSAMIGMRLYLPKEWTDDPKRCAKVGVPSDIGFQTKWQTAIDLLDEADTAGVRRRPVLADAGYGDITEFREELAVRKHHYVVGVGGKLVVWRPGSRPTPPKNVAGQKGRPRTGFLPGPIPPLSVRALVISLGIGAAKRVTWRQGSKGRETSWFGALRVRTAHGHSAGKPPGGPIWLLYQWPSDEKEPTKFWFSNCPAATSLKKLVSLAMLRWRVERDYQELKSEIGLDHFEGRTWRGFHHHVTLCAVAHAFLALQRASFSPSG